MIYLLDTNACIEVMDNPSSPVTPRMRAKRPEDLAVSIITKAELVYGAYNSSRIAKNLETLEIFLEPLPLLPFDDDCVTPYGQIRADLRRSGMLIGANDLLIAATAIAHDLIVVTANTREFERIPRLRIENWEV